VKRYLLDARFMSHPEPLEKAITILRSLDKTDYLYMVHRMQPIPLLALASDYSLNSVSIEDSGIWHILISPNLDVDLKQFINFNIDSNTLIKA